MLRDRIRKSGKAYRNILDTILESTFFPPQHSFFIFYESILLWR